MHPILATCTRQASFSLRECGSSPSGRGRKLWPNYKWMMQRIRRIARCTRFLNLKASSGLNTSYWLAHTKMPTHHLTQLACRFARKLPRIKPKVTSTFRWWIRCLPIFLRKCFTESMSILTSKRVAWMPWLEGPPTFSSLRMKTYWKCLLPGTRSFSHEWMNVSLTKQ